MLNRRPNTVSRHETCTKITSDRWTNLLCVRGTFSEIVKSLRTFVASSTEVTAAAPALLPLLLGALDTGLASLDTGLASLDPASTPRTVTNTLISLETFCHNLERRLGPHLETIMTRWVSASTEQNGVSSKPA